MAFSSEFARYPQKHSAYELAKSFREKKRSCVTYLEELFSHVESSNSKVNAITSLEKQYAFKKARELDGRDATVDEKLFGVPVVLKENIQKIGFSVSCGSKMLNGYRGQFDATAVARLEKAGAILIGSANMDEFAMGSSNEQSVHGPVLNPHDLTRVSGGSSGGPAVATTLGFAPISLGSDTGGSVRQPAAYCGILGFKPTYGQISRYGLVAYGSSLDQISPFARTAKDLDLFMEIVGYEDKEDATSLQHRYQSKLNEVSLKGLKIGIPRSLVKEGLDKNVRESFHKMEEGLIAAGGKIVDIEIKHLEHTLSVYYLIACAEASSNLSRFDGIRYGYRAAGAKDLGEHYARTRSEGFGEEVKRRIMLGTFALSAGYYNEFYGKAQLIREMMRKEFENKFKEVDFILTPTAPTSAFKLGEKSHDPMQMYLNDIFTIPANLAGICALSVPAPVAKNTLPIGLQFMAPWKKDADLIALCQALEDAQLIQVTEL